MSEIRTLWLADLDWDSNLEVASFEVIVTAKTMRLRQPDSGVRAHFGRLGGYVTQLPIALSCWSREEALTKLRDRLERSAEGLVTKLAVNAEALRQVAEALNG